MKVANQGIQIDPRMLSSVKDIYTSNLTQLEIDGITNRDWYEITLQDGSKILAFKDISSDYSDLPIENKDIEEINYVDVPLRRYSKEDGFYHA